MNFAAVPAVVVECWVPYFAFVGALSEVGNCARGTHDPTKSSFRIKNSLSVHHLLESRKLDLCPLLGEL